MGFDANLQAVRRRIKEACERVNRDPAGVELVAVSKTFPPAAVIEMSELDVNLFGENRVQEAKLKISACPANLRWHLIGHLQSNKARDAVRLFNMIHSVDSERLAVELNRQAEAQSRSVPILLEVNVAGEASKHGLSPDQLPEALRQIDRLPRLEIHGLMTLAPWTPEPEKTRPVFRRLGELGRQCEQVLGAPLPHLSMGMSNDFEVAIEEGATMVRIGSLLFGARKER